MLLTDFAARTESIPRDHKSIPDLWPVAIDYGFSAVKGFAPNKYFCFPNCAVKLDSYQAVTEADEKNIILEDAEGLWIIGEKAHQILSSSGVMNYESDLYNRNRYFTAVFRALLKAGLGFALSGNHLRKYHDETVVLQTGLPPEYMSGDDFQMLKDSIAGDYDFCLTFGKKQKRQISFTIKPEHIFIMAQPMGSLFSVIMDDKAKQSSTDLQILSSNTLILDPGFKTLDLYEIMSGMFKGSRTFESLGMLEIYRRTILECQKTDHVKMSVSGMQKALLQGYMQAFDYQTLSSKKIDFSERLFANTNAVCEEALHKVFSIYNYLQDHNYLVVTGGTGNAWFPYIKDTLSQMDGLTVLPANVKDPALSMVYSNVRGYYYYLIRMLLNSRR